MDEIIYIKRAYISGAPAHIGLLKRRR